MTIARPTHFVRAFAAIGGASVDLGKLPECALALLGRDRMPGLLVSTPRGPGGIVDVTRARHAADSGTERFCRAIYAGVAITLRDPVIEWEREELALIGDACRAALGLAPVADLASVWTAASAFRAAGRGEVDLVLSVARHFRGRPDAPLLLELALTLRAPDDETFAHCTEAVLSDALDMDDVTVRRTLHAVWPGSTIYDDHLAELAGSNRGR